MRANKLSLSFAINTLPIIETYNNYKEELKMKKIVVKLLNIVTVLVLAPFTIGGMVATACFELYKGIWKIIVGK